MKMVVENVMPSLRACHRVNVFAEIFMKICGNFFTITGSNVSRSTFLFHHRAFNVFIMCTHTPQMYTHNVCYNVGKMAFQGYTKPREYIVTEWPLKHTVGEFWSLIYDQECSAVVVLLQPPPNSVSVIVSR